VALDAAQLTTAMVNAALGVIKKQTPDIMAYAATEFRQIADAMAWIAVGAATGHMTAEEAALHLKIQRGASINVAKTVQGLGELEAEAAINAALAAVRETVNAALPFKLL